MTGIPFAYAFFSTLSPGARIAAHCGPSNLRLRMHIPIDIPSDGKAVLQVAGEDLPWKPDEVIIFDDSYVHSVRNDSDRSRTVLLVDFWNPDISPQE